MTSDDGGRLHDFVADRYAELRRSAFLMCRDWALADDLTQKSLARLVAESRRAPVNDPDAFVYSHLMASCLTGSDALRAGEPADVHGAGEVDGSGTGGQTRTILVLDALHKLAPRCRAVLVLRHWDGFAVEETADMLGLAGERVDAYEAAGLAALDYLLADKEPTR